MLEAEYSFARDTSAVAHGRVQFRMETFREGFERMVCTGEPPWEMLADDFVWDMSLVAWAEQGEYVGREGFQEFLDDWYAEFDDWKLEPIEMLRIGDQIVVVARQTARARGSGVPVDMVFAQIWSGNDQMLATRARMCESREQAIEIAEAEAEANT